MLFIKYVSDKYGDSEDFAPSVVIPKGASYKDMVALKGDSDIGNKINTQVIQPLIDANSRLARSDFPGRSVAVYHQHTLWTPLPNQLPSILDIQSELLPC